MDAVISWGIEDSIRALSFDTTASNSGVKRGACVLFEGYLSRNLIHLAFTSPYFGSNKRAEGAEAANIHGRRHGERSSEEMLRSTVLLERGTCFSFLLQPKSEPRVGCRRE